MAYLPFVSADRQTILGHYGVYHVSGALAATIGAAGHLARIRWSLPGTSIYCVPLRIRVGHTVASAVTTAVRTAYQAVIVRSFTVDFTTAITNTSMAGGSNRMRSSGIAMGSSLMGTAGPGIGTTTVMSGQTLTADAAPFAGVTMANPSTTLGAAAVTNQVGAAVPMTTLYERGADGFHPPVLSPAGEGIVIQPVFAGGTDGTFNLHVEWTWAEVLAF